MAKNNISYPHPVLGNGDDIAIGEIQPEVSYVISDEVIHIDVEGLLTAHPDIDRMVQSGEAYWHVRVQCARTYMRQTFLTSDQSWSVRLKGEDYEGTVEVDLTVVARKSIEKYRPDGLHADYGDAEFSIGGAEVIALGPVFSFLVDKTYDPLKAPVASLVRVDEGDHETGPFTVTLDDDLIIVLLSKTDWQEYAGIRDRMPTIIHSAIVLPALAEAIRKLENHLDTLWAGRLKMLLDNRDIDTTRPLAAAQEILANPIGRTFGEVNARLDSGD